MNVLAEKDKSFCCVCCKHAEGVHFGNEPYTFFYCLGCLKTLILNESQTQLVRKS